MKNIFISDIKRIKEASINDKLVIFVGAGVSLNSGIPTWGKLIDAFKDELPDNLMQNESDYLKIAQLYKNYRGKKEYFEKVKTVLKDGNSNYNPINEIIFDLKPSHIITTNYDNLLEQIIENKNYPYYKINKDRDLPYAPYNRFLIKMHGDFEAGNIVLTEDDYLNYNENFPLIESYIKSLFSSKLVLFIGFSFNDYNLKIITNKVKNLLGKDFPYMYLLNIGTTDCIMSEYYKNRGVKVIDFNDSVKNTFKESFTNITTKIGNYRGQMLYEFITFINNFNHLEYLTKEKHVIEQFYEIKQYYFDELSIIGGREITKIFPFNKEKKIHYFNFDLFTENQSLYQLQTQLKGNFKEKRKFLKKYSEKYYKLSKLAICNGIFSYNNASKSVLISRLVLDRYKDGVDLLYNLDFIGVEKRISDLKKKEINEVKIIDLELPYLLYKIGRYTDSYKYFKLLAQKSWKQNKLIIYFICLNNQKNVGALTFYDDKNNDIDENEYNNIDLNDILQRIQSKNDILYDILKKVANFNNINSEIALIDDNNAKIKESKENAINGGSSSNNYISDVVTRAFNLWSFTNNNFITTEHYLEHKMIYQKSFESFIVSHTIPEKNNIGNPFGTTKIKHLNIFHVNFVVFNSDWKSTKKTLEKHKVEILDFDKKSKNTIYNMVLNNINSINSNNDDNLKQITIKTFNNILILISKIEYDDNSKYNELVEKIINNKLIDLFKNQTSFLYFIKHHINKLKDDVIFSLLHECFSRESYMVTNKLVIYLINYLKHNNEKYKINDDYIKDWVSKSNNLDIKFNNYIICFLYTAFDNKIKKNIKQNINKQLTVKYDMELVRLSLHFNIPIYKSHINQFITNITNSSKKVINTEIYFAYALFRYYKSTNDNKVKIKIENISKTYFYLKFLIDYKNFKEYLYFNYRWLELLSEDESSLYKKDLKIKGILKKEINLTTDNERILDAYFKCF